MVSLVVLMALARAAWMPRASSFAPALLAACDGEVRIRIGRGREFGASKEVMRLTRFPRSRKRLASIRLSAEQLEEHFFCLKRVNIDSDDTANWPQDPADTVVRIPCPPIRNLCIARPDFLEFFPSDSRLFVARSLWDDRPSQRQIRSGDHQHRRFDAGQAHAHIAGVARLE